VGAGGHAQVIADAILSLARAGVDVSLIGLLDDNPALSGKNILGVRVLGTTAQLDQFEHEAVFFGIGDNAGRARVFERLKQTGETLISIIHPRATLAEDVVVGAGTVVMAGAVINTGALIGEDVIVNTGATIDHHARLGTHVHVAPGVHLGGTVTLGAGVFLGIGSNVIPNRVIGDWVIVGAGATVIDDLPARVTAIGVPARVIKHL
jgi:sugar O-acyltransferase (sialic acid O-acetyltransferase NeuD family)